VLQIAPRKVLEVGCGRGDHLHNLAVLRPELELYGVDISRRQIELLEATYPDLRQHVRVFDMSKSREDLGFLVVDLAYTQAVLMHIQESARYQKALENIFATASDSVILMENWTRHRFLEDIEKLHVRGRIPWKNVYYFFREAPELKRPHLMVVSSRNLPYPPLTDYSILEAPTDNAG
jgi:cyclopropane fatty-acyl-phospholipid synthase-like methyltransferase